MNVRKAMCTLEGNNIERSKVAVGVVMIICRLRPAGGLSVTCNLLKNGLADSSTAPCITVYGTMICDENV
jgi:hypothetical protein